MSLHRVVLDFKNYILRGDPAHFAEPSMGAATPQTNSFWDAILGWVVGDPASSLLQYQPLENSNNNPANSNDDGDRVPVIILGEENDRTPVILTSGSDGRVDVSLVDTSITQVVLVHSGEDGKTLVMLVSSGPSAGESGGSSGFFVDSTGVNSSALPVPNDIHSSSIVVGVPDGGPTHPSSPPPSIIIPPDVGPPQYDNPQEVPSGGEGVCRPPPCHIPERFGCPIEPPPQGPNGSNNPQLIFPNGPFSGNHYGSHFFGNHDFPFGKFGQWDDNGSNTRFGARECLDLHDVITPSSPPTCPVACEPPVEPSCNILAQGSNETCSETSAPVCVVPPPPPSVPVETVVVNESGEIQPT